MSCFRIQPLAIVLCALALNQGCRDGGCESQTGPNCPTKTLEIVVSPGVSSSLPPGSQQERAGESVQYRFELTTGYENLRVLLDSTVVPENGTVTMDRNHRLIATADSILALADEDIPLLTTYQSLVSAGNPMPAYRELVSQARRLIDEVGPEEAFARLNMVQALAFDPVQDAPALSATLREIGESLYANHSLRLPQQARTGIQRPPVTPDPVRIIYVNGVYTSPWSAFEQTRDDYLPPVVAQALGPSGTPYEIDGFYNRSFLFQPPGVTEVITCFEAKARLLELKRFSKVLAGADCLVSLAGSGFPLVGDLIESYRQIFSAAYGTLPTAIEADAARLALILREEIEDGHRVVLVVHSQGNLLAQQSLAALTQTSAADKLGCIGVVGIAPPTSTGWPVGRVRPGQLLVRGDQSQDIMLYLPYTHEGIEVVKNTLSDEYDRRLNTNLAIQFVRPLVERYYGVNLHDVNQSYLSRERTRERVLRLLSDQTATVIGNCSAGGTIAFVSNRDGNSEIYSVGSDGLGLSNLTNSLPDDASPAWSPDGSKLAYATARYGDAEVAVASRDGQGVFNLSNHPQYADEAPTWSPDGRQLAFQSFVETGPGSASFIWNIFTVSSSGSGATRLVGPNSINPSWSPDGKKIAFASGIGGDFDVFLMNPDGTEVINLTNTPGSADNRPAWSPDGSQIAFDTDRTGNWEIFVMNADGSGVRRLTNDAGVDATPAWSPDGSRIAFEANRDGNFEVYIMNADGSEALNLTNNPAQDGNPAWTR